MKKLPTRKKEVICTVHANAITKINYLLKMPFLNKKIISQNLGFGFGVTKRELLEIKYLLFLANKQACAMENRLYKYKEAIEKLGFKRSRKRYAR